MKYNKIIIPSLILFSLFLLSACQANSEENGADAIESLSRITTQTISETQAVFPSKNADEKYAQYLELKENLDNVDYELDTYEEYLERQFEQGNVNATEYHRQELELERLNDNIELAEETLDVTFGINE